MTASIDVNARAPGRQKTGRLPVVALVHHRRNPDPVPIMYRPIVDASRYTGAKLRAIRAEATNFLGEVRR